ncbi:hypothetical protein C8J56DRAFT_882340 [Mycena floridula]|nr:hypothetical protein C8J56DRAFT_882340 [Mycena floridula]
MSRRRVFSESMDPTADSAKLPARSRRISSDVWSKTAMDDYGAVFSDEYDLSQEDPRILQDVQRALKLKARREARLKLGQPFSQKESPLRSNFTPLPPDSLHAFPRQNSLSSGAHDAVDIDFSPSTAGPSNMALHPVPTSLDDGSTLDWSGPAPEEEKMERRWTLSITRHKEKEKPPQITMSALQKQEKQYAAKLTRIRTIASPHTKRKVAITMDQLTRRYNLIYNSLVPDAKPFNIGMVAKWHGSLGPVIREDLEKAEPFTWLKHLDKRGSRASGRLPWHLSALAMEEFLRHAPHHGKDSPGSIESTPSLYFPPQKHLIPSSASSSPNAPLGPSFSRTNPADRGISFEPFLDSTRPSLDSRQSIDSSYSSISGFSQPLHLPAANVASPASSHVLIRDPRIYHPNDSDDNSSGHNSLSGRSEDHHRKPPSSAPPRFELPLRSSTARPLPLTHIEPIPESQIIVVQDNDDVPEKTATLPPPRAVDRRLLRGSLPLADRLSTIIEQGRIQEVEENKIETEYELKAQLLRETLAQNSRIRQLLNRVVGGVKEFDMLANNLTRVIGIPYKSLPQDLLEAFSHDPAAVTGGTRRYRGWQAVDDIHNRLGRQRNIFQNFLQHEPEYGTFSTPNGVLTDPIDSLLTTLNSLEDIRREVLARTKEVSEVLKSVQTTHIQVKAEYNETLSHTSLAYPELSHIVALEESYQDPYQHFWDLGTETLTFFLDHVTPFWRTYGKTIGQDIQDFLIIPLYRNEFTGEAKRYPITRLPKRSAGHWFGLLMLFFVSVTVNRFQTRTAVTSTLNFRLLWITFPGLRWMLLPFFWITLIIQWAAVFLEFVVVLAQLGVLVWWMGWSVRIWT